MQLKNKNPWKMALRLWPWQMTRCCIVQIMSTTQCNYIHMMTACTHIYRRSCYFENTNLLFSQPLLLGHIDPLFQIFLRSVRTPQESDTWQNAITTREGGTLIFRNTEFCEMASLSMLAGNPILLPGKCFCFQLFLSKTWPKLSDGSWHF